MFRFRYPKPYELLSKFWSVTRFPSPQFRCFILLWLSHVTPPPHHMFYNSEIWDLFLPKSSNFLVPFMRKDNTEMDATTIPQIQGVIFQKLQHTRNWSFRVFFKKPVGKLNPVPERLTLALSQMTICNLKLWNPLTMSQVIAQILKKHNSTSHLLSFVGVAEW